jgi:hypothetical protein
MTKKLLAFFFLIFLYGLSNKSFSQNIEVYPSHWWVGMKWNKEYRKNLTWKTPKGSYIVKYLEERSV